jgi:hypothetical protein
MQRVFAIASHQIVLLLISNQKAFPVSALLIPDPSEYRTHYSEFLPQTQLRNALNFICLGAFGQKFLLGWDRAALDYRPPAPPGQPFSPLGSSDWLRAALRGPPVME